MFKTKIAGAVAALALLAAPSVAAAHDGHHHRGHHHKHHSQVREVTGAATATVASFDGKDLTLTLPSGRAFTAGVTDATRVFCFTAAPQAAAAHHGRGDDEGDDDNDKGDDDGAKGDDDGPSHDAFDDNGQGDVNGNGRCGTDALVAGAKVRFAKLSLANGDATWKKVVIVK